MPSTYVFGRLSDQQVYDLAMRLFDKFNAGSFSIGIGDIGTISGSKTASGEQTIDGLDRLGDVIGNDTYFITEMSWTVSQTQSVKYYRQRRRGTNPNGAETWVISDSPFLDGLEVKSSGPNSGLVLNLIHEYINMAPPIVGGVEAGSALDQSNAILNRVSESIVTLVEHTAERQKDLDATRDSLAKELGEAIASEKEAAQARIALVVREYEAKQQDLEKREAALDDRANTHVRRELSRNMASLSDTQLAANLLTKSNKSFIVPLAISVVPIIILFIVVWRELGYIDTLGGSISDVAKDAKLASPQKVMLIANVNYQIFFAQIRIAVQSVGIAALVWFSLRLASSRYSLVSGWERDLHRFRLDTERAGFLVEGDLEARKVNNEGLPEVLLQSFSRNLFSNSEGSHGATSSEGMGGTLNALLGQAAKVKVGTDGVSVEVERKGIRKAAKLIEDE